MSGNSVLSLGGFVTRTSTPISMSGNVTLLTAFKYVGAPLAAADFVGIAGAESTIAQAVFFLAGSGYSNPNALVCLHHISGGATEKTTITSLASIVGKGVHLAYTRNTATGAQNVYAAFEGSPGTLLITPTVGSYDGGAGFGSTIQFLADSDGDLGTGVIVARSLLVQAELTQAQVIAQFGQRAPTAAVTAASYSLLGMQNAAAPNIDIGSTATNFATDTSAGSFSDNAWQPTDWATGNGIFFGAGTTS